MDLAATSKRAGGISAAIPNIAKTDGRARFGISLGISLEVSLRSFGAGPIGVRLQKPTQRLCRQVSTDHLSGLGERKWNQGHPRAEGS
jgi:hypothetical protein